MRWAGAVVIVQLIYTLYHFWANNTRFSLHILPTSPRGGGGGVLATGQPSASYMFGAQARQQW